MIISHVHTTFSKGQEPAVFYYQSNINTRLKMSL